MIAVNANGQCRPDPCEVSMRSVRNLIAGAAVTGAAAALAAAPTSARAQSEGAFIAYAALNATPPGAFAPIVTPTMLGDILTGPGFVMRYGRVDLFEDAANNFAVTLLLPSGPRTTVNLTAGYWNPDCEGCDGHPVLGAGMDGRLAVAPLSDVREAAQVIVGISGELGFAKPEDVTFLSATIGLPVSLVVRTTTGLRIAPFLTPAFGVGYATGGGQSESGTRFMIGGGIGIQSAAGFLLNAGFQKVLIDEGRTTIGVNAGFRM
jgi:hypothetical protein